MTKGSRGREADHQQNGRTKGAEVARIAGPHSGTIWSASETGAGPAASAAASGATLTAPIAKNSSPAGTDDIVIGFGVTACGKLHTSGCVFVDGVLRDADVEGSRFSVSRDGVFQGRAHAQRMEIAGTVEGELSASEEIVLRSSSSVSGRLSAPYIVVHRGATVSGETTTLARKPEVSRYMYAPPPSLGRRRIKLGPVLFSALLVVMLSSGGAFALLTGS